MGLLSNNLIVVSHSITFLIFFCGSKSFRKAVKYYARKTIVRKKRKASKKKSWDSSKSVPSTTETTITNLGEQNKENPLLVNSKEIMPDTQETINENTNDNFILPIIPICANSQTEKQHNALIEGGNRYASRKKIVQTKAIISSNLEDNIIKSEEIPINSSINSDGMIRLI